MLNVFIDFTERGLVPSALVRAGIRRLCETRLQSLMRENNQDPQTVAKYVKMLRQSPVAMSTDAANKQHYEVPAEFFKLVLGPHLKYSCAYWGPGCSSLVDAEAAALETTVQRAELQDGMNILELGCGWGSLSLAMAEKFKNSKITAVSNSSSQKIYIDQQASLRHLKNLTVLTFDVSQLKNQDLQNKKFDRVVSVEMFEHLRNYEVILGRIKQWLNEDGKLFVHIFTHQKYPYLFETEGSDNWMGKYFFTGGQMPSRALLGAFQKDLNLQTEWEWSGEHYKKTAEAWLKNHENHRDEIIAIFKKTYGLKEARRWYFRWKVFFLAVAELFGYRQGSEWGVTHYLFAKKELPS
jgi:cyclopropane-fatty-acyl-phospholipid synthase